MTAIDCTDCYLAIAIGDGVKRALVRHFTQFIRTALARAAVAADWDGAGERVDRDAWRLAARVVHEVEAEIEGALDETLLARDPQQTVQEILSAAVEAAVADAEQHYLGDDFGGFAALRESRGA